MSENVAPQMLGTVQSCQVLWATLAAYTYAMEHGRNQELFLDFFCERKFPVTLLNNMLLSRFVLDNTQDKAMVSYKMTVPNAFKVPI